MIVYFRITIVGSGEDLDECWEDAVENLYVQPGSTPDAGYEQVGEEEYNEEEEEE